MQRKMTKGSYLVNASERSGTSCAGPGARKLARIVTSEASTIVSTPSGKRRLTRSPSTARTTPTEPARVTTRVPRLKTAIDGRLLAWDV
jgi:hypothetical protein